MEIFRWQDGTLHQTTATVGPGDAIGKADKGIDFNTGFTMVDVSRDPNDQYVLLIDPAGQMVRRTSKADTSSPDYQKLKQQLTQAQAAAPNNGNLAGAGAGAGAGAPAGKRKKNNN